jgi:hypothetical protein
LGREESLHCQIIRARVRDQRQVWALIAVTETGFPWLHVAGKVQLTG